MLKADFHIHSKYSMDCDSSLEDIISRCQEMGLNCIAIADHGTAEGGLKLQSIAPFKVIIAEEILTPYGEVMGMFLKETIPTNIPVEEAISRIKAQGALVSLPHPFDTLRGLRVNGHVLEALAEQIDAVEVFNARSIFPQPANKARAFATKYNLPRTAGSDAHTIGEIGSTYVEMPDFNNKEDFLAALRKGRIHRHRSNLLVHFGSTWAKIKNGFKS